MRAVDLPCSALHVAENDDFGLKQEEKESKSLLPTRLAGHCSRCTRTGWMRLCSRCQRYFCESTRAR